MKIVRNREEGTEFPFSLVGESGIVIRGFERREEAESYREHIQKFPAVQ